MYYRYSCIYNQESAELAKIDKIEASYIDHIDFSNMYDDTGMVSNDDGADNKATDTYNDGQDDNDTEIKDCDCIIKIPSIKLHKIIYNGKHRDQHLQNYELITATPDMKYSQGGNYIICGHASRLYGHSLNRLKEIKKGDIIKIRAHNVSDVYKVYKVEFDNMYDTNKYCKQTENQELTIVSCAKYVSQESYIVVKARKE